MLTDDQLDLYARHIVLPQVGGAGQQKLLAAHVIVIGAGGIGCPVLQYLAAAGVGKLTIIDDDKVSLSNLQRQILYTPDIIGEAKVDAAARAIKALNPEVEINAIRRKVTADSVAELIRDADVIIDGSDNFACRLLVADEAYRKRIPLVSAAIAQFHGQIGTFRGWEEGAPCYRCFVGDAHDPDECDSCAEQGVLGAMCGLMGSFAAMEAVRQITGFGAEAVGKLHVFDGLKPEMRTIRLPKDPGCSVCGSA